MSGGAIAHAWLCTKAPYNTFKAFKRIKHETKIKNELVVRSGRSLWKLLVMCFTCVFVTTKVVRLRIQRPRAGAHKRADVQFRDHVEKRAAL